MAGDASTVVPCPDSKSITSSIAASKAMTLIAISSPCALTATEQFTVDSRRSFYSVARTDHGKVRTLHIHLVSVQKYRASLCVRGWLHVTRTAAAAAGHVPVSVGVSRAPRGTFSAGMRYCNISRPRAYPLPDRPGTKYGMSRMCGRSASVRRRQRTEAKAPKRGWLVLGGLSAPIGRAPKQEQEWQDALRGDHSIHAAADATLVVQHRRAQAPPGSPDSDRVPRGRHQSDTAPLESHIELRCRPSESSFRARPCQPAVPRPRGTVALSLPRSHRPRQRASRPAAAKPTALHLRFLPLPQQLRASNTGLQAARICWQIPKPPAESA